MLQSPSAAVSYEAAWTLVSLSGAPTAIRAVSIPDFVFFPCPGGAGERKGGVDSKRYITFALTTILCVCVFFVVDRAKISTSPQGHFALFPCCGVFFPITMVLIVCKLWLCILHRRLSFPLCLRFMRGLLFFCLVFPSGLSRRAAVIVEIQTDGQRNTEMKKRKQIHVTRGGGGRGA